MVNQSIFSLLDQWVKMAIISHLITCTVASLIMVSAGYANNDQTLEAYVGVIFFAIFFIWIHPGQLIYCFVSPHLFRWFCQIFKHQLFVSCLINMMIGIVAGIFVVMSFVKWQEDNPLRYVWIFSGMMAGAVQSFLMTLFWRHQWDHS